MRSQSDGTVRRADDVRFIHCRWEGRKMQAQESGASTAAMHRTAGRTGKNRAAGLTVLELLITLTVASVLTSIAIPNRSDEHTSELQSLMRYSNAVLCLKK